MQRYLATRLTLFIPTLLLASLVVFGIMRALPGDVALVVLSGSGEVTHDVGQIERVREELGLNKPLARQYLDWLVNMVNGELGGRSFVDRTPLTTLIARQLPVTLQLATYTVVISAVTSIPLGVVAATRQDRWPDYVVRTVTIAGQAVPSFFFGLVVLLGLLVMFSWSPPVVYANLWEDPWSHVQLMVWPTLVLAWSYTSYLTRMTRASLLEVLRQDYIRTAHTKGLPVRTIVLRHALRNALIPVITAGGLQVGVLLGGAVLLETIFGLPGLGSGIVDAAVARDYPVIQSLAMLLVLLMLCVNLITDLLYAVIDPRISYAS